MASKKSAKKAGRKSSAKKSGARKSLQKRSSGGAKRASKPTNSTGPKRK